MVVWVYRFFREAGCYTVGHYDPRSGEFIPESDYATADEAAGRVRFLNGSNAEDESGSSRKSGPRVARNLGRWY